MEYVKKVINRLASCVIRQDDSEEEKVRKQVFICLYPLMVIVGIQAIPVVNVIGAITGSIILIAASMVGLVHLLATKSLPKQAVVAYCCAMSLVLMIWDYTTAASGFERTWPAFIIVIDILLVCHLSEVTLGVVCVVVVWLFLTAVEDGFRFGFYDLGLGKSQEEMRSTLCGCETLPCADLSRTSQNLSQFISVFLLDFLFTRGFARAVDREKATMQGVITTAQHVAHALAAFDLEKAKEEMDANIDLPPPLYSALENILQNLESYKEYLPESCLPVQDVGFQIDDPSSSDAITISERSSNLSTHLSQDTPKILHGKVVDLTRRHVSLLVTNMKNFKMMAEELGQLRQAHTWMCTSAQAAVGACKGVLDGFLGDHVFASFNASRGCGTHACSAVHAAKSFLQRAPESTGMPLSRFNAGVATGRAFCGDMGCTGLKRFTLVGDVPLLAAAIERFGSDNNVQLIINDVARADAYVNHKTRLLEKRIRLKGSMNIQCAWEVIDSYVQSEKHAAGCDEWMYELEANGNPWDIYNKILLDYLLGHPTAVAAATSFVPTGDLKIDVAVGELRARICSGESPAPPTII